MASNQQTLLNAVPLAVQPTLPPHCDESGSNNDPFDMGDDGQLFDREVEQQPPKRKRGKSQWMETAALALSELGKGAKPSPTKNDEWRSLAEMLQIPYVQ